MGISQKIQLAISEALTKDEALSRTALYTKLSEVLKISLEEVKKLLQGETFTEEQKKMIAETLGTTTDKLAEEVHGCPAGHHMEGGVCVPDVTEAKPESNKLKESLDKTFGSSNEVTKKLDEIKKVIDTNSSDEETKKFMNEVVRHLIEVVPMVASMNPKMDEVAVIKTELKALKEQLEKSTVTTGKLEAALTEAKALSTKAEKTLNEMKTHPKGLHETGSEKSKTLSEQGSSSFENTSLSQMLKKN